MSDQIIKEFAGLFRGRPDIYGLVEGRSVKEPVTEELYRLHLEGKNSLGIYPLLDDGKCYFAAVDLDIKDFPKILSVRNGLLEVGVKSYICQSKSKGFHLFLFADENGWVAKNVREMLLRLLHKLNFAAEVFPKQDKLDDVIKYGNYINLPNFGDTRPFLSAEQIPVPIEQALQLIQRNSQTEIEKAENQLPPIPRINIPVKPTKRKTNNRKTRTKSPPCVEKLLEGVESGMRDEAAFALARHYLDQGASHDEVLARLLVWDARNKPPIGDMRVLQTKVESAQHGYEFGCKSITDSLLSGACADINNCLWLKEALTFEDDDKKSQATLLVELLADDELFHTPDGDAYATVTVDNHKETWPLRAKGLRRWLMQRFYEEIGKTPGSQAYNDALGVLEGMAQYHGEEYTVFTRIAELDGAIYLDLANKKWEAVKITKDDWQIVKDVPVRFRRAKGMLPLPSPSRGGSIEELRPFVNIPSDREWVLLKAWLVQACRPIGPYPPLVINGEAGSTKTTTARILRGTIDPNSAALRSEPRETRDLMIAAKNSWIVAFDNLSHLPIWLSDDVCRLATGGGFATRELYSDQDEVIFEVTRPVILSSIEELVVRGDLVDRAIILTLPQLPKKFRRTEKKLWADFNAVHPRILGSLLDAVAMALRNEPNVNLTDLPRMADFAIWATAAEPALGLSPGEFMNAYQSNREAANETVLENSTLATAVKSLIAQGAYSGTPTQLFKALGQLIDEDARREKSWPKSLKGLRGNLTRLAPNLRATGIDIKFWKTKGTNSQRMVSIKESGDTSDAPDAFGAGEVEALTAHLTLSEPQPAQPQTQSVRCDTCAGSVPQNGPTDSNFITEKQENETPSPGKYKERF